MIHDRIYRILRIVLAGSALWLVSTVPARPGGTTASTRGEKQFSFTDDQASVYNAHPSDSQAARLKREHFSGSSQQAGQAAPSPVPSSKERQQPGQAGEVSRRSTRDLSGDADSDNRMNRAYHDPANDGASELRRGQITGQVGNAPGSTVNTPGGPRNSYGTEGIPIFPDDLFGNGKVGQMPPP